MTDQTQKTKQRSGRSTSAPEGLDCIPVLGSGLGFRPPWFDGVMAAPVGAIDFLEITADHYLDAPDWKLAELDALRERFIIIPHALDLSIGSAEGVDDAYLDKLAALVERVDPPYWSEHLAFTKAGGRELGHLAPLPFSREAVEAVARNVERVREVIQRPLILENITYGIRMPGAEMSEAEFLRQVFTATGCGWLFDVTNLHINSVNHGEDSAAFLQEAPVDHVVQLHYVGFSKAKDGRLIDDHGSPVSEEIWSLMDSVLASTPAKGVLLERDANLPCFTEIEEEVARAREMGKARGRWI